MNFNPTDLAGSYLIELELKNDSRGFFSRLFCAREFSDHGLNSKWVQVSMSSNKSIGTLRGLHFQSSPKTETKLVRCQKGAIWDVIVDLRAESRSYGQWFSSHLTAENRTMVYVPERFAHGFITLEPNSEVMYFTSEFYEPRCERTLIWDDQSVGINWPMKPLVISDKDLLGKNLSEIDS